MLFALDLNTWPIINIIIKYCIRCIVYKNATIKHVWRNENGYLPVWFSSLFFDHFLISINFLLLKIKMILYHIWQMMMNLWLFLTDSNKLRIRSWISYFILVTSILNLPKCIKQCWFSQLNYAGCIHVSNLVTIYFRNWAKQTIKNLCQHLYSSGLIL